MTAVPLVATVAAVLIAIAVRVLVRRPCVQDAAAIEAWSAGATRSKPENVDLATLGIDLPPAGRVLGVVFTHPACESCDPVARRVDAVDAVDLAVVDVSADPEVVRAAGITAVPTLVLVGSDGGVVRSWVGTPLAGTVEETVRRSLG